MSSEKEQIDDKVEMIIKDFLSWFDMYRGAHSDIGTTVLMTGILNGHINIIPLIATNAEACAMILEKHAEYILENAQAIKDNTNHVFDHLKEFFDARDKGQENGN